MTRTPPAKIEAVTLPWRVKIGFGISGIGRMISSVLVTTYVFYFYTEILLIPSSIATTVTLIGRIWAWFCDPTMGTLIDHASPNKEGKTRHITIHCSVQWTEMPAGCRVSCPSLPPFYSDETQWTCRLKTLFVKYMVVIKQ